MSKASYYICILGIYGIGVACMLLEVVIAINTADSVSVITLMPITFMVTLLAIRIFDSWIAVEKD